MKKTFKFIFALPTILVITSCNNAGHTHQFGIWVPKDEYSHYRVCDLDYSHVEEESHHFDKEVITKEPQENDYGMATICCVDCGYQYVKTLSPLGNYTYDQKIINDKYLFKKQSDNSALYYMSSTDGHYGDPNYVFEVSSIPEQYSELDYVLDEKTYINKKFCDVILPLESNANDCSNNEFTFKSNKVTYTNDPTFNKVASFDGSSSYLYCETDTLLKGAFSVCAWVNCQNSTSNNATIFSYRGGSASGKGPALFIVGSNKLRFDLENNSCSCSYPTDKKWHFVAATFDGSYRAIYIDGKQKVRNRVNSIGITSKYFTIGASGLNSIPKSDKLKGMLTSFALYNRVLKDEDINFMFYNPLKYTEECNANNSYVPVIENSTFTPHYYDKENDKIIDITDSYSIGNVISHNIKNPIVTTEATYCEDGVLTYTCTNCGTHIHASIPKTSYHVLFNYDKTMVKEFRIYYDTDKYNITDDTYTRNEYSHNYSCIKASVVFEIIPGDNYLDYVLEAEGYELVKISNNRYMIHNITSDTSIDLNLKIPN